MNERFVVWRGVEEWLAETATVQLTDSGVRARGTQIGAHPLPYRLDYTLDARDNFVTESLEVTASGEGWRRRIVLARRVDGAWSCETDMEGTVDLPAAGGDVGAIHGALDCDLAFSPLTNLMPVRRHRLHEGNGERDFLMAWVSVPDLAVTPAPQRYIHIAARENGSTVRFVSLDGGFTADLDLDELGLVRDYPRLARRVFDEEMA